jgi:hypothetical protein
MRDDDAALLEPSFIPGKGLHRFFKSHLMLLWPRLLGSSFQR